MSETLTPTLSASTQQSERVVLTNKGRAITQVWIVPAADVTTFETDNAIGLRHPSFKSYISDRTKEPYSSDGSAALFKYTVVFTPLFWQGVLGGAGSNPDGALTEASDAQEYRVLRGDSNMVDVPIKLHPDWAGNAAAWAVSKADVEIYKSPQPTFTSSLVEPLVDTDINQSELIEGVGKIWSPAALSVHGLTGASDNKWLCVNISIVNGENNTEKTYTWQYASNGWDTDLYEVY